MAHTPDKGPNPFDVVALVGRVESAAREYLSVLAQHLTVEEKVKLNELQASARDWFVLAATQDTEAFLNRADAVFDALQAKYQKHLKPKIV